MSGQNSTRIPGANSSGGKIWEFELEFSCLRKFYLESAKKLYHLHDGNINVVVTYGDEELRLTLIKDIRPPTVDITQPVGVNAKNQHSFSFSGNSSEQDQFVTVKVADAQGAKIECDGTSWALDNQDLAFLTTATFDVTVNLKDAVGNPATEARVTVNRDVEIPVVTVTTTDFQASSANAKNFPWRELVRKALLLASR